MVEERRSKKGARREGGRGRDWFLGARPFLSRNAWEKVIL